MTKWKRCPKCNGFMPDEWNKHTKCGWTEEQMPRDRGATTDMINIRIKSMEYAVALAKKYEPKEGEALDIKALAEEIEAWILR